LPYLFGAEQSRRITEGFTQPVARTIVENDRATAPALENVEVLNGDLVFSAVVIKIGDVSGKCDWFDGLVVASRTFPGIRFHI
jgi:hypothetical protein